MAEALGGFVYRYHSEGSDLHADWYPAPLGTPIGWPEGGTVYMTSQVGPDGPSDPMETAWLLGDSGWTYSFTHVYDIAAGRKEAWEGFARVGVSGIAALPGDPAHIHFAVAYRQWPNPSPNGPIGTVPAVQVLERMGFGLEIIEGRAPGPQDYLAGHAIAGRWV